MDAFDEAVDSEGSQASLVLQDLITEDDSNWTANEAHGQACKLQSVPDNHPDSHSSSSRNASLLHRYHYHGLATTQTQTQQCGEDEQLQKENSRNFRSNKGAVSTNVIHKGHLPSRNRPKPSDGKLVSTSTLQSSRGRTSIAAHKPAQGPSNAHSKSRDRSQDSFAREPSQDPEEKFVATSKQFEVPLSELGRESSPARGRANATRGESRSSMFAHAMSKDGTRRSASPEGNVLVASTPSQDGNSQSESGRSQATQSVNRYNDFVPNRMEAMDVDRDSEGSGYESSEPSSSFLRLLKGEPDPIEQVSELQATQPSTQPADVDMEDAGNPWILPAVSDRTSAESNLPNPASTSTATTFAGRRGLLSMVNPKFHYRYQKYQNQPLALPPGPGLAWQSVQSPSDDQAGNPSLHQRQQLQPSLIGQPIATGDGWQETQPSFPSPQQQARPSMTTPMWQETQPSLDDQHTGPRAHQLGPPRPVCDPNVSRSPSISKQNNVSPPHPTKDIDFLDVIPDSEPLRSDPHAADVKTDRRQGNHSGKNTSHLADPNTPRIPQALALSYLLIDDDGELTEMTDDSEPQKLGTKEEEEDGGEDDDDDVPLATKIASSSTKMMSHKPVGNGRKPTQKPATPQITIPSPIMEDASEASILKGKQRQVRSIRNRDQGQKLVAVPSPIKANPGRSLRITEIPSSVVEQSVQKPAPTSLQPRPTAGRPKPNETNKKAVGRPKSARSTRSKPTAAKSRGGRMIANQHAEEMVESDDELPMSSDEKKNEDGIELANKAEYMEVDQPVAGPSSRKRKRAAQPSRSITTRNSSKPVVKLDPTLSTRYTKRLKPAISANGRSLEATRVFALWKQDGHYYSGHVNSVQDKLRYQVKFDDGTDAIVSLEQMRRCDLRVGDDVLVANFTRASKVVNLDRLKDGFVTLDIDGEEHVNMRDIRLAHKTVSHTWMDRMLSPEVIIPSVTSSKGKPSPTPSKTPSISGSTSSTSKNSLNGAGLIVTLSVGNENWEKEKVRVMNTIRSNGGKVIDDVSTVIRMEGRHSLSGNRWIIHKSDVRWTGKDIDRLLLVADDANQKPKFLIALALGIPCVSTSWLNQLESHKDWLPFLLPQGYSDVLGARASQQIDVDWGNSIHQLKDIMSNAVPCKLFAEKAILCVGPEMVPQPKGKRLPGVDEKAQEAINAVARIILAMGADSVEAVADIRHASGKVSDYDFVIIREADHYSPELSNANTVHWSWVKDCLIASRYLPLPVWPGESENSQDL